MGYQVFPAPSSSVDLGKYSFYSDGSPSINPTTASLSQAVAWYLSSANIPAGTYRMAATGADETQTYMRRISIWNSAGEYTTITPSQTAQVSAILDTAGTSWGFKYLNSWSRSAANGVFRYATNNQYYDIKVYDTGYSIIGGYNGNGINDEPIKVTTNGTSFTRYLPAGLSTSYWGCLFTYYSPVGYFAALNSAGGLYQSTDIVNWTRASTADPFVNWTPNDGYYDTTLARHYVVGNWGNVLYVSTNGTTNWSTVALTTGQNRARIVRAGSYLMTLGQGNADVPMIEISTNGTNWTKAVIPTGVATWSTNTSPTIRAVAYNGTRYVAASDNGAVITSTDGLNWTTSIDRPTTGQGNFYGAIWDGTYFIVAGLNATTNGWRFSTNGTTWGSMSTAAGQPITNLNNTYTLGLFYNTNFSRKYYAFHGNQLISSVLQSTSAFTWATNVHGTPVNDSIAGPYIVDGYPSSITLT